MKKEIKVCLAIDDYKIPAKETWWRMMLAKMPEIEINYELVKEERGNGLTKDTTHFYRTYRLRGLQ